MTLARDLIVFGEDWGHHPSSTQHLVRHLLKNRQVVWFNSIGLRSPRVTFKDTQRIVRKAHQMFVPSPETKSKTKPALSPTDVRQPKALPLHGSLLARTINRYFLQKEVFKVQEQHTLQRPILWASLPSAIDAISPEYDGPVVYYCGDDFSALSGVDHEPVSQMEEELVERADLIIAASDVLASKFPRHKTIVVPHGADVELFSTPTPRAEDLPNHPLIAGFYGSIAPWLDLTLLYQAALAMPHWHFAFVGPVQTEIGKLATLSNVSFLGPKDHDQLPGYAQHWQASLLPFKQCPQIEACNPLKLREYLAAGQPIISSNFPAVQPYQDLIGIYSDLDCFKVHLEVLEKKNLELTTSYQNRVQPESWSYRAEQVNDALNQL